MSRLTQRGFTQADADAFIARANLSHTVRWKATAYRFTGTSTDTLMDDVPIIGGTLTLDSSDPIRRKLTLEVGGGEALVPQSYLDPLVPFGQWLTIWVTIDRLTGGSWFPWLKMGEYPITSYTFERPSQIATVEATDWSGRVDEYLHLGKRGYKGVTVANAVSTLVNAAVPGRAFNMDASNAAKNTTVTNYVADAGTGRWTAATDLCDKKGLETFFDAAGNLIIRDAITDDQDDVVPGNGPDIGTVSNPIATIAEGTNMVGLTSTLTREGGCNYVRLNLSGTRTRKLKKQDKKKEGIETKQVKWTGIAEAEQRDGPAKWGDVFGFLPIVQDLNLHKVGWSGSDEERQMNDRARRLLQRRRGVIRYLDLDMAGGYWLEPDDRVKLTFAGATEYHFVQSVSFDLAGHAATRIRTRQLAVTDPGGGA